jgi:uncharacterized protein YjbI with pentapeptide repeats
MQGRAKAGSSARWRYVLLICPMFAWSSIETRAADVVLGLPRAPFTVVEPHPDPTTMEIRAAEGLSNDTTAGQVTSALFKASKTGMVIDFSHRGMKHLDLSGLDFKGARLNRSDVFGTDLSNANLSSSDLAGARLDRTVLTFANFSGANLEGATLMRPTIYSDLRSDWREAPVFDNANLRGVRLTGRIDGASFKSADLSGFDFSPHDPRADISFLPRNFCRGCRFDGAILRGANFDDASLAMASFANANLAGARLTRTDLSRVDFKGADLTGADLTGADLADADLRQVKGLESAKGLGLALNLDKALR